MASFTKRVLIQKVKAIVKFIMLFLFVITNISCKPVLPQGFGEVSQEVDAKCNDKYLKVGDILTDSNINLTEGVARYELTNGLDLTIYSSSSLEIKSPKELSIEFGKFFLVVPFEDSELIVKTNTAVISIPKSSMVGLVVKDNSIECYCFLGKAEVYDLQQDGQSLQSPKEINRYKAIEMIGKDISDIKFSASPFNKVDWTREYIKNLGFSKYNEGNN